MTPVRAYLHATIAAMAIAFCVHSAPANATVSTPFGSINAGGFGLFNCMAFHCPPLPPTSFGLGSSSPSPAAEGHWGHFGISTPFGGVSGPGFGPFGGNFGGFGLGNAGPGAGGYYTGFGVSTPWGGFSGPGFGLGNAGPGAGGYYTGFGVSTPWGGFSGPGFGIGMPCGFVGPCTPHPLGFGVAGPQQALSVSTPFGGFSGPGFGVNFGPFSGNFGGFGLPNPYPPLPANFGISTPWGGMNMGGFGIVGQQPQVMPIYWPNY